MNPLSSGPCLFAVASFALAPVSFSEDWPHFLGPKLDLHSAETGLRLDFPESGPELLWEVERGRGHAAPVVVGGRVVYLHQVENSEQIRCLDAATGAGLWEHSYSVETGQNYGVVDAPRTSPTADPETGLVYTLGNDGDLVCLRLENGEVVWRVSLPEVFGPAPIFFGYGSSPLVHGDKLIVNVGSEDTCVAAFDNRDGKVLWRSDHAWHGSYASPVVAKINGQDRILVLAGGMVKPPTGGLLCVHPETGVIESELSWRSSKFASILAASPVPCGENRVFITEDYGLGGAMVQYDEAFQPRILWTSPELGCQFQTPIHHEGILYGVGGSGGLLLAYDVRSGRHLWNEAFYKTTIEWQGRPIPVSLGHAHLIHVDGGFLCLGEDGVLLRLRMGMGGFEILAKARLFYAPETWAPPVVSGGRLYVMQNEFGSRLVCYDLGGSGSP